MAALPVPVPPISEAAAALAGAAILVTTAAIHKAIHPNDERSRQDHQEDASKSPEHEPQLASPERVRDLADSASYEPAVKKAAEDLAAAHPILSDPRSFTTAPTSPFPSSSQAAREPPIRLTRRSGGGSGIEIPFPFSLPFALGALLLGGDSDSDSDHGYQYARKNKSSPPPPASTPPAGTTTSAAAAPPPENEDEKIKTTSAPTKKISKRQMERLLRQDGANMYKKIKHKAAADFGKGSDRTVWSNTDYRIDFDHFDSVRGIRQWNLQVNRGAESNAARDLLEGGRTTHTEIYKGQFNASDPPSLDAWKRSILEAFKV